MSWICMFGIQSVSKSQGDTLQSHAHYAVNKNINFISRLRNYYSTSKKTSHHDIHTNAIHSEILHSHPSEIEYGCLLGCAV